MSASAKAEDAPPRAEAVGGRSGGPLRVLQAHWSMIGGDWSLPDVGLPRP